MILNQLLNYDLNALEFDEALLHLSNNTYFDLVSGRNFSQIEMQNLWYAYQNLAYFWNAVRDNPFESGLN